MPKTKKKTRKTPPKYHLEINFHDKSFETDAATLEECLKNFVESPELPIGFKTQVVIKANKGKEERTRILGPAVARRVFGVYKVRPMSITMLGKTLARQFEWAKLRKK